MYIKIVLSSLLIILFSSGCNSEMPKDSELLAEEVVNEEDSVNKEKKEIKESQETESLKEEDDPVEIETIKLKLEISNNLETLLNDPNITDNKKNKATLKQIDIRLDKLLMLSAEIEKTEKNLENELNDLKEKKSRLLDIFWEIRSLLGDLQKKEDVE